ncbi:MAG: Mut7-C RNAse domain-containing protein [Actinomycetota bacterium]
MGEAVFRFYAELCDFLDTPDGTVVRTFDVSPSVKDLIESSGVPHTEVDLVLVNGESVDFAYRVRDGDRVSVYPVFETFDVGELTRVRTEPLRTPSFVLDVHLGRLARYLRLLGFDVDYSPHRADPELVEVSRRDARILLTRDVELLKHGDLTHGLFLRSSDADDQVREVVRRLHLSSSIRPFTRCLACNGLLAEVEKEEVASLLPEGVRREQDRIWRCGDCGKLYWRGSHMRRLEALVESARRM